jgi:peptide/nickel transport system substrate-binding protein
MLVTPMRLLIAIALTTLSVLPVAAQSDAGNTLRMVPHADLAIVDPYFSGVYITRNFGYLVYDTCLGWTARFTRSPRWSIAGRLAPTG